PRRREAGGFKIVGGGGEAAGNAEVENLDAAVGGEHDVLRLEVTVEDAGGVGGGQSGRHRGGDAPYLGKRQRSLGQLAAQGLSVHPLHDHVGHAVGGPDIMDGDDVGMVQRAGGTRLGEEAGLGVGGSHAGTYGFDGHRA